MRVIEILFNAVWKLVVTAILLSLIAIILFVAYKGNQPMQVSEAPQGMTYFEFMEDRLEAARTVKPARCGWGMMASLATVGSLYSFVYTEVGIHPDGTLAHLVAPDTDIPTGVDGAEFWEIPGIWWDTVERISWTMMGRPSSIGCQFPSVGTGIDYY